jgi:hypothetical protein
MKLELDENVDPAANDDPASVITRRQHLINMDAEKAGTPITTPVFYRMVAKLPPVELEPILLRLVNGQIDVPTALRQGVAVESLYRIRQGVHTALGINYSTANQQYPSVVNDRSLCQWLHMFPPPKGKSKKVEVPQSFVIWLQKKVAAVKAHALNETDVGVNLEGNGLFCKVFQCSALDLKQVVHPRLSYCKSSLHP